jgi:hypothetical protein
MTLSKILIQALPISFISTCSAMNKMFCLVVHGNTFNQNAAKTTMSDEMYSWCKQFFDLFGDQMPNESTIHMPSYCSMNRIHEAYTQYHDGKKTPKRLVASENTFRNYVKNKFSHVRYPKKTRLGRCNYV